MALRLSTISLILVAMATLLMGCASGISGSRESLAGPQKDTDLARKLTAQGVSDIDQNRWNEAQSALLKALDADVTFGQAHNNLGTVYLHEGNLYQAAWEFQYAAKLM